MRERMTPSNKLQPQDDSFSVTSTLPVPILHSALLPFENTQLCNFNESNYFSVNYFHANLSNPRSDRNGSPCPLLASAPAPPHPFECERERQASVHFPTRSHRGERQTLGCANVPQLSLRLTGLLFAQNGTIFFPGLPLARRKFTQSERYQWRGARTDVFFSILPIWRTVGRSVGWLVGARCMLSILLQFGT